MNAGSGAAIPRRWVWPLSVLLLILAGCGDDTVNPDPECAEADALPFGETRVGDLRAGDPVRDGSRIDYYGLLAPDAGTLTVEMASEEVDPFLYLWAAAQENPSAQAFDPTGAGPVRTARLVFGVSPGCYRVGASGWPSAASGEYTIRAEFTR